MASCGAYIGDKDLRLEATGPVAVWGLIDRAGNVQGLRICCSSLMQWIRGHASTFNVVTTEASSENSVHNRTAADDVSYTLQRARTV